jgi:hypothetical protein
MIFSGEIPDGFGICPNERYQFMGIFIHEFPNDIQGFY